MITDKHRGLALELSLTKLLHSHPGGLQIIGMSATIGGAHSKRAAFLPLFLTPSLFNLQLQSKTCKSSQNAA